VGFIRGVLDGLTVGVVVGSSVGSNVEFVVIEVIESAAFSRKWKLSLNRSSVL